MNSLRLLAASALLMSLAACATTASAPRDESILDVIDRLDAAPVSYPACRGNTIKYCEIELGARHCECRDEGEVRSWLGRLYGTP